MTQRQPTAYNLFIRENAPLRPPSMRPQDWMRELGRRWRNRNQEPLLQNNDNTMKECCICYTENPLTFYSDGPCQHHKDICKNCIERVEECPFCRHIWRQPRPPPPNHHHVNRRQRQETEIRLRIQHITESLADIMTELNLLYNRV